MIASTDIREAINCATRKQAHVRGGLYSRAPESPQTGTPFHPTASLEDVVDLMQDGDGLFYSGPLANPVSLGNRIYTCSEFSHYGTVAKSFLRSADVIDWCCVQGCTRHPLRQAVRENHGQSWRHGVWFWARINREAFPKFNGVASVQEGMNHLGEGYGYSGILLQWMTAFPVAREVCFFTTLSDCAWFKRRMYCSYGGQLMTIAGGVPAVRNKPAQLVTPQDMAESDLFINPFIALVT